MSDFAEKLEVHRSSTGGKAQASRRKLLERRGSAEDGRDRVTIDTIGGREVWKRLGGGGAPPRPDDVFEQEVRS